MTLRAHELLKYPPDGHLRLEAGGIHVWFAALDLRAREQASARDLIDSPEAERYSEILDPEDRDRSVACRAILRTILSWYTGHGPCTLRIDNDPGGKPLVAGGPKFNVSHSAGFGLFALSADREVGVDLEVAGPAEASSGLALRFLPEESKAHYLSLPPRERARYFYQAWTEEEALLKAQGKGLQHFGAEGRKRGDWNVEAIAAPAGMVASIAYRGKPAAVTKILFPESALNDGNLRDPL